MFHFIYEISELKHSHYLDYYFLKQIEVIT